VVKDKKRGQNSPDLITIRKQLKANDCWQEEPIPIYNTFEELEEVYEDANNSTKPVRELKPSPIFISKFSDPPSLRQLFNQIANDEFDLKNINVGNFKIQIKSSKAYTNIVKELKSRNIEFHLQAEAGKKIQGNSQTYASRRENRCNKEQY